MASGDALTPASRRHVHASGIESCSIPLIAKRGRQSQSRLRLSVLIPAVQAAISVEKVHKQLVHPIWDLIELVDYARNLGKSLLDNGTSVGFFNQPARGRFFALSAS
jgi:hypothetical protein